MKSVKIVLSRGKGKGRKMEGVNLRYIVSTDVNISMHPSAHKILYANKIIFKK
jgi:hypothetical protein